MRFLCIRTHAIFLNQSMVLLVTAFLHTLCVWFVSKLVCFKVELQMLLLIMWITNPWQLGDADHPL